MSGQMRRLWLWFTGDTEHDVYKSIRTTTAIGSLLSFAVWGATYGPAAIIERVPVNTLSPGSWPWWVCWFAGVIGACLLGAGRLVRMGAASVAIALQVCGGISANWATMALLLAAAMLVFAPSRGSGGVWPLRVLQLQLPLGYCMATVMKLTLTDEWRTLRAFRHLLAHPMNVHSWPVLPDQAAPIFDVLGLSVELGAGVLLLAWLVSGSISVRRVGLALSAALHVGIALVVPVGLFPFAVAPLWLAHTDIRWGGGRLWWWVAGGGAVILTAALLGPGNPFSVL